MSEHATIDDVAFAWSPDIGGAVISLLVKRLSADGSSEAFASAGIEDDRAYLERGDGQRFVLSGIDAADVTEALELGVVMVREFADEGHGASREYRVEGLAPASAPGM